jgi:hypothetical protein
VNTKKLLNAVEDGTHVAIDRLSPYLEQALREGGEFADHTYSRVRPAFKDASIRGARFAADTFEKVHPAIDDAIDKVYPAVNDVLERIPPTVDFAREKVQEELLPSLADQLRHLASQPLAHELRVAAASAALAKQLDKASGKKKHSGWKTFGKIVLAGAILGGVAVAVKKLLADPSSGWETYTPRDNAYVADPVAEDWDEEVEEVDSDSEITEEVPTDLDGAMGVPTADGDDADPLADSPYGEGSYIGDEPPADYLIKGNDRSKKYHVPGSASYERTSAEVWFVSEEAAQAAGFVKAQR